MFILYLWSLYIINVALSHVRQVFINGACGVFLKNIYNIYVWYPSISAFYHCSMLISIVVVSCF